MPEKKILTNLRQSVLDLTGHTDRAGELYKSLFEKSHAIMLIIHPDSGRIIDANIAACSFYHYSRDELTAKNIMDINMLTPKEVKAEMAKAEAEENNYFTFRHRLATGEIRDVEVYSSPIKLGDQKVLYSIIHDITQRKKNEQEREDLIRQREQALEKIKVLQGILPLCSFCKKIRDSQGHWEQVDAYIHHHSEADVSHTVCPQCMKRHYPEYDPDRNK